MTEEEIRCCQVHCCPHFIQYNKYKQEAGSNSNLLALWSFHSFEYFLFFTCNWRSVYFLLQSTLATVAQLIRSCCSRLMFERPHSNQKYRLFAKCFNQYISDQHWVIWLFHKTDNCVPTSCSFLASSLVLWDQLHFPAASAAALINPLQTTSHSCSRACLQDVEAVFLPTRSMGQFQPPLERAV